ncbi:Flavin reductase [Planctomycetales bacterium 10988]|nr:Flavin reductase [Planctomycetales bacterium 10988]
MLIDLATLDATTIYHLMVQTVIPRPIAWVLSENGNQSYNLAPFSYFNAISSSPPTLMISVGHKKSGEKKDTWLNIEERKHFNVHIVSRAQLETMVETAAPYEHGISEVEQLEIETVEEEGFQLPRLKQAKVALACELYQLHEIGTGPQALIIGEIKQLYIEDSVVQLENSRYTIDANEIDPMARLGGNEYVYFGGIEKVIRPKK